MINVLAKSYLCISIKTPSLPTLNFQTFYTTPFFILGTPLRLSLSLIFPAFWLISAEFFIKHAQQTGHLTVLSWKRNFCPLYPLVLHRYSWRSHPSLRSNWMAQPNTQICWESATYNQVKPNRKPFIHNRRLFLDKERVGLRINRLEEVIDRNTLVNDNLLVTEYSGQ